MSLAELPVENVAPTQTPHEPQLVPGLSRRWALHPAHLAATCCFCLLGVMLNHLPLRNTDVWGHIVAGRHIVATGTLPTSDLLQPLAEGMRMVDVNWLSQVVFAAVERKAGPEGLISLFTIVVGLTYLVSARTSYLLTRSLGLSTIVTALVLGVGWNRITTIRPENFAMLLFATLLWLIVARRVRRADSILADDVRGDAAMWIGIPVIAALWANLHGSFPLVVAVLGCSWFGRLIEVARHERSLRAVLVDREARRQLYWLELAFAATLVNPYGLDAWIEAVRFSSNPNLVDIVEWNPLVLVGTAGREFALACAALAIVWRSSRRPIVPADALLLVVFGIGAALQIRMTGWFAFVWGINFAAHLADVVDRWLARTAISTASDHDIEEDEIDAADARTPALRYRYTLACAATVWIAFAFTTFSRPLLGGAPRAAESLYSQATPLRVAAWLQTQSIDGLAYCPQYWGDWFGFVAPSNMKLFATSNMHMLPRVVWADYHRIAQGEPGWEATADKYAVRTMIVDKTEQPVLARLLRTAPDWGIAYDDDQATVFRRKVRPAVSAPAPSPAALAHP